MNTNVEIIIPCFRESQGIFSERFWRIKGLWIWLDTAQLLGINFGCESFCDGSSLLEHDFRTISEA